MLLPLLWLRVDANVIYGKSLGMAQWGGIFFEGALSFFSEDIFLRHNLPIKVETIWFLSRKQPYYILTNV